jgi:hypothetical protein
MLDLGCARLMLPRDEMEIEISTRQPYIERVARLKYDEAKVARPRRLDPQPASSKLFHLFLANNCAGPDPETSRTPCSLHHTKISPTCTVLFTFCGTSVSIFYLCNSRPNAS